MQDPIAFAEDTRSRPYDAAAVERFHRALLSVHRVLELFRTSFLGKVSPVHLFWGSFDLAVTRFSGAGDGTNLSSAGRHVLLDRIAWVDGWPQISDGSPSRSWLPWPGQ